MNPSATNATAASAMCDPAASAIASPSSPIRLQFHSTTSRGAYSVCDTAIAVNTMPNAPHAATIAGWMAAARMMITGENVYSASAMYPPALPYSRRATYHSDAPNSTPMAMNGSRARHRHDRGCG